MDPGDRERFLEALRRDEDFRAAVRRELLTEELLNLPTVVAALVDAGARQREDFSVLSGSVRTLSQTVAALVDAVAQQRQDFTAVSQTAAALVDAVAQQRQDFTALSQTVADSMQETISVVRQGFAQVGAELRSLRTEVGELRTEMDAGFTAVRAKFDQVDADLQDIRNRLAS